MLTIIRTIVALAILGTNAYAHPHPPGHSHGTKHHVSRQNSADLIIFTKDRPLQLQACLESLQVYVTGLQDIVVLCHAKNDQFYRAYKTLEAKFPRVTFVYQSRSNPRADFWPLIKAIFSKISSPYFMFGVDDTIVVDFINIESCIKKMRETNAYAFYPYMGKNITHCYMTNTQKLPPALQSAGDGFCTWDLRAGQGPWGYAHNVMMAIYKREDINYLFSVMEAQSPNRLEEQWGGHAKKPARMIGLCYETSHQINVPINLVQQDCPWNNCSRKYTIEQMLDLFEKGWRIDIKKLYRLRHNAPHIDIDIPLTQQLLS